VKLYSLDQELAKKDENKGADHAFLVADIVWKVRINHLPDAVAHAEYKHGIEAIWLVELGRVIQGIIPNVYDAEEQAE